MWCYNDNGTNITSNPVSLFQPMLLACRKLLGSEMSKGSSVFLPKKLLKVPPRPLLDLACFLGSEAGEDEPRADRDPLGGASFGVLGIAVGVEGAEEGLADSAEDATVGVSEVD
jgi:hypothetical protein